MQELSLTVTRCGPGTGMAAITPTTWGQHTPHPFAEAGGPCGSGRGRHEWDGQGLLIRGQLRTTRPSAPFPCLGAEPLVQGGSPGLLEDTVDAQVSTASRSNLAGLSLPLEDISKRPMPLGGFLSIFSH